MNLQSANAFTAATAPIARFDIAEFAATLKPDDPLYWPALHASAGCEDSLRELNEMLVANGMKPFPDVARRMGEAA